MTQAFTLHGNRILRELRTGCRVSKAFKPEPELKHKLFEFECLWDTGATGTVISPGVVKKLGLKPIGKTNVTHGGGRL